MSEMMVRQLWQQSIRIFGILFLQKKKKRVPWCDRENVAEAFWEGNVLGRERRFKWGKPKKTVIKI